MTTIILLRHLKTLDDERRQYTCYNEESPLCSIETDELASFQSELSHAISKFNISHVYHSGNQRGSQTLDKILPSRQKDCLEVVIDRRLRNIEQPEMKGLSFEEIQKREVFKVWNSTPHKAYFVNGECLQDVEKRCKTFLSDIKHNSLIISHTTPLQVILCNIIGLPTSNIWSLKFDHLRFNLLYSGKLLRLNSTNVTDCNFNELTPLNFKKS